MKSLAREIFTAATGAIAILASTDDREALKSQRCGGTNVREL